MRSLRDIWTFAFSPELPPPPPLPPSPDELAKTFAAALIASGRYEDLDAAVKAAWWAVPAFYQGRQTYVSKIAPLYFLPFETTQETEDPALNSEAINDREAAIGGTGYQA